MITERSIKVWDELIQNMESKSPIKSFSINSYIFSKHSIQDIETVSETYFIQQANKLTSSLIRQYNCNSLHIDLRLYMVSKPLLLLTTRWNQSERSFSLHPPPQQIGHYSKFRSKIQDSFLYILVKFSDKHGFGVYLVLVRVLGMFSSGVFLASGFWGFFALKNVLFLVQLS